MFFKDLQKNTPFFVIDNSKVDDFKVYEAKVINVSQPRFADIAQQFSNKVVDLNVTFNNSTYTYTVNETAENIVCAPNGTTLIIDQQDLQKQLKMQKCSCEATIKDGEIAKAKILKINKCLENYDFSFKKEKEYDEKLDKLASQVSMLTNSMNEFFKNFQQNQQK
ncbi:MAG: hypothetical protein IJ150_03740 [Bacteroidales bacterium]|nr:hypothetical protein [Bacteroidales bacterium]